MSLQGFSQISNNINVSQLVGVDVTYFQFHDAILKSQLQPGTWYRITDYQSVNFLNGYKTAKDNPTPTDHNFNPRQVHLGDVETLLVQAISPNQTNIIAYSETYPEDILYYNAYINKLGFNLSVYNGVTLPDTSVVSGFDLQWDGTNVYFEMPTNYHLLFGHYMYIYADFNSSTYGQPTDYTASGTSIGNDVTYGPIQCTTLTGEGYGLQVLLKANSDNTYVALGHSYGFNYKVGDTVLVPGSRLGGTDGVNDAILQITSINGYYAQDGLFSSIIPGINFCQFPYSNDDPSYNYPKAVSRLEVVDGTNKVLLLDLTHQDFLNYNQNSLYIETIYGIADSFGQIIQRIDTQRNITSPFDFRGYKYRRFEVDLTSINPALGLGYWGIGDDYLGKGTTGNYQDFFVFGNPGYYAYNIKWTDMTSADGIFDYLGGVTGAGFDNTIFAGNISDCKFGTIVLNNTIADSFLHNVIGDIFRNNVIGTNFYANNIKLNFDSNTIGNNCQYNNIETSFVFNNIGSGFQLNSIGTNFQFNTIGNNFNNNYITAVLYQNTIGNDFVKCIITDRLITSTIGNGFKYNTINYEILGADFSSATYVYNDMNCTILKGSNGAVVLQYFDGTVMQYTGVTS